ncbi:Mis12 protein-domain-containing protein [Lipomyces kononenkoae]|uniref:Mis12 protein-domain-containing protein n=1 Tax=Lipomyces kononenkoae TaxID=34357 RepID=A0ACC3SY23_LIPKO
MAPLAQPTASTTALLTEHFEYPPIALLDDIINAVNSILYKCTSAIETFLQTQPPCTGIPDEEIEVGTAKLETLLEGAVDRNFDRFELYVLRNVLAVPDDVADGWMRLAHHRNIDFSVSHENLDIRLLNLRKALQASYHVNDKLQEATRRNRDTVALLRKYQSALSFLQNTSGIAPMHETVRFLVSQAAEIKQKFGNVHRLETSSGLSIGHSSGMSGTDVKVSEREIYIEKMTAMIVGAKGREDMIDIDAERKNVGDVENSKLVAEIVSNWS